MTHTYRVVKSEALGQAIATAAKKEAQNSNSNASSWVFAFDRRVERSIEKSIEAKRGAGFICQESDFYFIYDIKVSHKNETITIKVRGEK